MESKNVKELVVYTIKPEFKNEIIRIQELVKSCLTSFNGFQDIESYQSTSDKTILMDWVSWNTLEDAKHAQKEFEKHPKYNSLMSYFNEMRFADHFTN